jgi:hypothetical protein
MDSKTTFADLSDEQRADVLSEQYCDLYNKIEGRPDGETVLLRAIGILRVLAYAPVCEEGANPFPEGGVCDA